MYIHLHWTTFFHSWVYCWQSPFPGPCPFPLLPQPSPDWTEMVRRRTAQMIWPIILLTVTNSPPNKTNSSFFHDIHFELRSKWSLWPFEMWIWWKTWSKRVRIETTPQRKTRSLSLSSIVKKLHLCIGVSAQNCVYCISVIPTVLMLKIWKSRMYI